MSRWAGPPPPSVRTISAWPTFRNPPVKGPLLGVAFPSCCFAAVRALHCALDPLSLSPPHRRSSLTQPQGGWIGRWPVLLENSCLGGGWQVGSRMGTERPERQGSLARGIGVSRGASLSPGSHRKAPSLRGCARVQKQKWQLCGCSNSWWPRFSRALHASPAALGSQLRAQASLQVKDSPWPRHSRLQVSAGKLHIRLLGGTVPCSSRPVRRSSPGQAFSVTTPDSCALGPNSAAARPEKDGKGGGARFCLGLFAGGAPAHSPAAARPVK